MSRIVEEIARGEGQSLTQLAKLFPPARRDKPVTLGCVLRWVLHGVRLPSGETIRLEAARCSGRWLSTRPAVERFLAAQTPAAHLAQALPRSEGQRRRAADRAAAELTKVGI
ncbi:MAG: hypothetical protein U0793_04125 [Gemmataceae bacterium]